MNLQKIDNLLYKLGWPQPAQPLKKNEPQQPKGRSMDIGGFINGWGIQKAFPYSITFKTLENMAKLHEISRACINTRKRQIASFDWDIVPIPGYQDKYPPETIQKVKQFFKYPLGHKLTFREFINEIVEDLLVFDAVAIYLLRNRAGQLIGLDVYDASSIRPQVDQWGHPPDPPQIAYLQYLNGIKTAEFTTKDLYYTMMNPSSRSVYGFSPLEGLILTITSSLFVDNFNLSFFQSGNLPDGVFILPPDASREELEAFKQQWDTQIRQASAGQIFFLRGGQGVGYQPFRRPNDMSFQRYHEWHFRIACMMFDITPSELGYTEDVNRATAIAQYNVEMRKGLRPLLKFLEEIFDELITTELGYPDLTFAWLGLEYTDPEQQAKVDEILIRSGIESVDEIRTRRGLAPVGISHLISSQMIPANNLFQPPKTQKPPSLPNKT